MKRLVQLLGGLLMGLVLVELGFWARDGGAFPHVRCYLPDPVLGLRLEPGASQRISFSNNPVTSFRVNSHGLRGAALVPPSEGEIVVVGDSQVFGLGVEDNETFSAQLAVLTGRPVVNAGVPTYGPPEYAEVARRLVEERAPATVVFTVNMVNDLFEWNAPNTTRHAEWDGWAVRVETAPRTTASFPGRRVLMGRSHTVFAARRLIAQLQPAAGEATGFPSEGSWSDLVNLGHLAERQSQSRSVHGAPVDLSALESALEQVQTEINTAVMAGREEELDRRLDDGGILIESVAGHPGDIIGERNAEESRSVAVTARLMRRGVQYRQEVIARLEELENGWVEAIKEAETKGRGLREQRQAHARERLNHRMPLSVLHPELERLRDFCEDRGVELVVVVLPMDVQVSDQEWAKYEGATPVDMSASLVLTEDLIGDATALGLIAVDTLAVLRDAEPGAFLDGDIHMTAKGHAAVAEALAAALTQAPPVRLPQAGLPEDRTWMPRQIDWLRTPEATVKGSTRARCETMRIEEWLRVTCLRVDGRLPTGISEVRGDRGESRVVVSEEAVTLVTPLFGEEAFAATFHWQGYGQILSSTAQADGTLSLAFSERQTALAAPLQISSEETRLCACFKEVREESVCAQEGVSSILDPDRVVWSYVGACELSCGQMSGGNLTACDQTFPDSCADYLACAEGQLQALPLCPTGTIAVGGGGLCMPLCADATACPSGLRCAPWRGSGVCR